eukprot:366389-Chlamydomonas_euryale.AAC.3
MDGWMLPRPRTASGHCVARRDAALPLATSSGPQGFVPPHAHLMSTGLPGGEPLRAHAARGHATRCHMRRGAPALLAMHAHLTLLVHPPGVSASACSRSLASLAARVAAQAAPLTARVAAPLAACVAAPLAARVAAQAALSLHVSRPPSLHPWLACTCDNPLAGVLQDVSSVPTVWTSIMLFLSARMQRPRAHLLPAGAVALERTGTCRPWLPP